MEIVYFPNCLYHRNYQEREPVTIRIEPDAILLYNSGGPDRSIKREDFVTGKAIPKRYRNRRLGDFLKELKLTEGHATGLPALKKAMQVNGSPEPVFDFDEERTWFQVLLTIHHAFKIRIPFTIEFSKVQWNLEGINNLLNHILEYANIDDAGGIAGGIACTIAGAIASDTHTIGNEADELIDRVDSTIAGTIAEDAHNIDIQASEVLSRVDSTIVSTIADAIAGAIGEKEIKLLMISRIPISRENLLASLGLKNLRKNYEEYAGYLVNLNWLTMTIPNKPTSPKQQYLTTLKGRLILEFLKHKIK